MAEKKQEKQSLLIWGDAPCVPTGFGEVANNLFCELHKEYQVDIVGINYWGLQKYDTNLWYIYPVQEYHKMVLPKNIRCNRCPYINNVGNI